MDEIIIKAQRGDKEAFTQLIQYYKNDLYKIAKARFGNNEDDINDAIQETIITAYTNIEKIRKVSSFKSWLIKILINKCNDIYKKNYNIKNIPLDTIENESIQYNSNISTDEKLDFNKIIGVLEYEERLIMILYYTYGYKSTEIGKILKIKPSTIRSKMKRAKKKLQEKFEGRG